MPPVKLRVFPFPQTIEGPIELHDVPPPEGHVARVNVPAEQTEVAEELPITVSQVIAIYLEEVEIRLAAGDFDDENFANLKRSLVAFSARFGALPVEQCRRHNLDSWIREHPRWKAPRTKKREIGFVTACFNWAEDTQHIAASPYRGYRVKNVTLKARPASSDDQYLELMRRSPVELRRLLVFYRGCGSRTCEARELVWAHVDLEAGLIVQPDHKTSRQQRDPAPRIIPLPSEVLALLHKLIRQTPASTDHVFLDDRGQPWTRDKACHAFRRSARLCMRRQILQLADPELATICGGTSERALQTLVSRLRQMASSRPRLKELLVWEQITLYSFRHQKATELVEDSTPDQQICDLMGWTGPAMIRNYKHTAGRREYFQALAPKLGRRRRSKRVKHDLPGQQRLF